MARTRWSSRRPASPRAMRDYDQVARGGHLGTDRARVGIAFERFTAAGPLALLPLADGPYTVVWTPQPGARSALATATTANSAARAAAALRLARRPHSRGRAARQLPAVAGARERPAGQRVALIGNAAQALHPVAGQGFNLGLRDAAMLAEVLIAAPGDPGAPELLAQLCAAPRRRPARHDRLHRPAGEAVRRARAPR